MKKALYGFLFVVCVFMVFSVWGQVQHAQPVSPSAVANIQLMNSEFDKLKLEVARLKTEIEQLTKIIKVSDNYIEIKAESIQLNGNTSIYKNAYLYGQNYAYNAYFKVL
jgi:hypothetical protein